MTDALDRPPIDLDQARRASDRAAASDRQAFGDFFLSRLLGLEITYPGEACEVRFTAHDFLFNPQGSLHGGILATTLDIAMGHLLRHQGAPGVTLELKVQYVAAVRSGQVTCRGEVLQRGRSVAFLRAEARAADGTLLAYATATWKLLRPPP